MKTNPLKIFICCFVGLCQTLLLQAQAPYGNAGDLTPVALGTSEASFGYYEYLPTDFDVSSVNSYPLLLCYHGYDQRGNGTTDLSEVLDFGTAAQIRAGRDFEAIVIVPQSESGYFSGSDFIDLYNYLIANYPIDLNRVYVTGFSAGGGGTWNALKEHSDKIAAAVPICGTDYLDTPSNFLQQKPIWAFHNFNDPVVDRNITISNVDQIANNGNTVMSVYPYGAAESAADSAYTMQFDLNSQTWSSGIGANEPVDKLSFTLYNDGEHDAWTRTYNNYQVYDWMFAQHLGRLGVNEEKIDFKLFPNPCSNNFTITSTNLSEKELEVYDVLGAKIYQHIFSNELTVDMSGFTSGIYFASAIENDHKLKVFKIILN